MAAEYLLEVYSAAFFVDKSKTIIHKIIKINKSEVRYG